MAHSGSPDRIPVSAVLITKDAERHLDRVLAPLAVCAEIVVLDSGSTDRTRDIADAHGAAWHEHPFDGYGPQKRRAVALAAHDWILAVDADEVLDAEAAASLAAIAWPDHDVGTCWKILRRPFIGDREIRHGDWAPDRVVRVFNRQRHNVSDALVHESVRPTARVLRLGGSLLHFTSVDLAGVFRPDYYRLKAEVYRRRGRKAGSALLATRAVAAFVRGYVLRLGFLDGTPGLVVALAAAVNASVGLGIATDDPAGPDGRVDESRRRP
jgi:glycosyltransferase involved in cell wall biosynthesis